MHSEIPSSSLLKNLKAKVIDWSTSFSADSKINRGGGGEGREEGKGRVNKERGRGRGGKGEGEIPIISGRAEVRWASLLQSIDWRPSVFTSLDKFSMKSGSST